MLTEALPELLAAMLKELSIAAEPPSDGMSSTAAWVVMLSMHLLELLVARLRHAFWVPGACGWNFRIFRTSASCGSTTVGRFLPQDSKVARLLGRWL